LQHSSADIWSTDPDSVLAQAPVAAAVKHARLLAAACAPPRERAAATAASKRIRNSCFTAEDDEAVWRSVKCATETWRDLVRTSPELTVRDELYAEFDPTGKTMWQGLEAAGTTRHAWRIMRKEWPRITADRKGHALDDDEPLDAVCLDTARCSTATGVPP